MISSTASLPSASRLWKCSTDCWLYRNEKTWGLIGTRFVLDIVFKDEIMRFYRIIAPDGNHQCVCNTIITIETEFKVDGELLLYFSSVILITFFLVIDDTVCIFFWILCPFFVFSISHRVYQPATTHVLSSLSRSSAPPLHFQIPLTLNGVSCSLFGAGELWCTQSYLSGQSI